MTRKLAHVLFLVIFVVLAAPSAAGAATTHDVRGEWDLTCSACGPQTHIFATQDADGNITGQNGQTTGPTWTITGKVTGDQIVFTVTYTGGGYSSTSTGTINAATTFISGTFDDTAGHIDFPFQMHRLSGGNTPPPSGNLRPSRVQVMCTYRYATDDDLCTATVADAGVQPPVTPTGTVKFSAGGRGVFTAGDRCTLQPTPNSPGIASCSVVYVRPYEAPPARTVPNVNAQYQGDSTHAGSEASTRFLALAPAGCGGSAQGTGSSLASLGVNRAWSAGPVARASARLSAADKRKFNIASASCGLIGGSLGLAAAAQAGTGVGAPSGAATGVVAAGFGLLGAYYGFVANVLDPFDPHWRSIVKPRTPRLPRFARGKRPTRVARAFDRLLAGQGRTLALFGAFQTSIYRAQSAAQKHSKPWTRRQMVAAAGFLTKAARALQRHPRLVRAAARALRATKQDRRLTPDGVRKAQAAIRSKGLPRALARSLRRAYGSKEVAQARRRALRVDPATINGKLSDVLSTAAFSNRGVAAVLRKFANGLRATPLDVPGLAGGG